MERLVTILATLGLAAMLAGMLSERVNTPLLDGLRVLERVARAGR